MPIKVFVPATIVEATNEKEIEMTELVYSFCYFLIDLLINTMIPKEIRNIVMTPKFIKILLIVF